MQRGLIDEEAMRPLAVFAQRFAVVSHDHEERVVVQAQFPQAADDPADPRIDVGDPAGILVVGERLVEGRRRLIGPVGVVVVQEEEERFLGGFFLAGVQPGQPQAGDLLSRAAVVLPPLRGEAAVVGLETLVQAEPRIEGESAHEGRRLVAGVFEDLGQRHVRGGQAIAVVRAHPMQRRIGPREH